MKSLKIMNMFIEKIFNIKKFWNPFPYDLSMWPRIIRNWTLATINHEPDQYCLPCCPIYKSQAWQVLFTFGSIDVPWLSPVVRGSYGWPDLLTTSLKQYFWRSV